MQNKCKRGNQCKWSHEIEGNEPGMNVEAPGFAPSIPTEQTSEIQ